MNDESAKAGFEDSEPATLAELLAALEREFPVLVEEAAYDGPPAGLFRELDLAHLPLPARHVLIALGRLLWRHFETLRTLPGVPGTARRVPALDSALAAIAGEFRFAAKCLSAAHGVHRVVPQDANGRAIGQLGMRSLRRLQSLIREIDHQLPALLAARGVSGARRAS